MRFALDIRGFEELFEELLNLPSVANASMARVLNGVAQSTAIRTRNRILTGGRSGRIYQTESGVHRASAPGEPPANLSGALAASYTFTRMTDRPGSFATAGSDLSYAATLELSGFSDFEGEVVWVAARPHLLPSFEEAIVGTDKKLKDEFERSLR